VRRAAVIVAFVTVMLGVVVGGHVYLDAKLALRPALPPPFRALVGALVVAGALLLIAQPIAERLLSPRPGRWIAWPSSVWMGFAFFLLVGFLLTDLVRVGLGAASVEAARVQALVVVALATAAVGLGVADARRGPAVARIAVTLSRWPAALDGFRVVQISDVHIGPILGRRFAADVTAQVNALAADLIAVTGDLVDGDVRRLADEVAPFAELRASHGVFFVTGNHDYYSGADAWVEVTRRLGMTPLRNTRVAVERDGAAFELAGVEDHHAHLVHPVHRSDVAAALAGRDAERALVLLAHDPLTFKEAARHGVDLQLSGHTHGGQIWPFRWLVRLSTPYVAGSYRAGDAQLYVSRGTGFWGPAMRLFAPAEITEITIRAGAAAG
jgi:uncharacterized protein